MKHIIMKGTYLGEFEEIVLLTVGILFDDSYGLAIKDEVEKRSGRKVMLSAIHKTLKRLEAKGFLNTKMGESTPVRGGRRKKLYSLTIYGKSVLSDAHELRTSMWSSVPAVVWESK